ncbi:MAG: hypothetical protein KDI74_05575 [Gammaproteobacteria bacterium]|nr:hypothetical protein [Gammaproteobacteria bacterium]
MKIASTLLLIPVVALAQAPGAGMDRGKMLEQMKQSMLPMMEQSLPEMEKTRQCVQASKNSADLNECAENMRAFQQKMMAGMKPPPGARPPAGEGQPGAPGAGKAMPPPPKPQEIEWSEKKRDEIVQGLDISIKQATAMKGCLQSSNTPEQMDSCMEQAGLGPKRPE